VRGAALLVTPRQRDLANPGGNPGGLPCRSTDTCTLEGRSTSGCQRFMPSSAGRSSPRIENRAGTCLEPKQSPSRAPQLPTVGAIDVMLSAKDDFTGGVFRTLELQPDGCSEVFREHPDFQQGDAMVFVSHKYHGVASVRSGTRRVCVVEYWAGEERSCPHRCKRRIGTCPYRRTPH
jgi:hypothetical protein